VKLVVGLGNPGEKYQRTRHNLGYFVIDQLARQKNISIDRNLCNALIGEGHNNGEKLILAKPQTFMNRSGVAVYALLDEFCGSAEDLIVVYDDLDLPFGRIRIRPNGSAGGHRGIISIMESLAGAPFTRVRVGIGRPPPSVDAVDYVLEPFTAIEASELPEQIARVAAAIEAVLKDGIERAMEIFNRAQ
jgi:peptidyl-tRNA hydrolase, PTH1 family